MHLFPAVTSETFCHVTRICDFGESLSLSWVWAQALFSSGPAVTGRDWP